MLEGLYIFLIVILGVGFVFMVKNEGGNMECDSLDVFKGWIGFVLGVIGIIDLFFFLISDDEGGVGSKYFIEDGDDDEFDLKCRYFRFVYFIRN